MIQARTRHLLSAFLRKEWERARRPYRIEDRSQRGFPSEFPEPRVSEKIEAALFLIADRSGSFGTQVSIDSHCDWPLISARDEHELGGILGHLVQKNYLERYTEGHAIKGTARSYAVTGDGWQEVTRLRPAGRAFKQAFVAMWFDEALKPAFDQGFEPGLQDAGYDAFRVDRKHPDQKIDDYVLLEIRRSGLLVADLTGFRPNVILEAGFAMGIGIPVVWTCRADEFDRIAKDLFDARQYPYLVWKEPGELRNSLRDRVLNRYPVLG